jgi:hypothetical protein
MARRTVTAIMVAAAGLAGALTGVVWIGSRGEAVATMPHPQFNEVAWPFQIDEWGIGKAYHCRAADCGAEVELYIRPKIGFCNCTTGVSDDAELERLSDFLLIGGRASATEAGRPIRVAWMEGRSRAYDVADAPRGFRSALSIAFNDKCDAVIASVVSSAGGADRIERGALEFLNSPAMVQWVKAALND